MCNAAQGALICALLAFIAAVVIAAIVIGAIVIAVLVGMSCALTGIETWSVGCWVAVVVGIIAFGAVVAAATLAGATVGGLVAVALSQPSSPTDDSGTTITVGNLISVHGNMMVREEWREFGDNLKVNVFWWVRSSMLHGRGFRIQRPTTRLAIAR